MRKPERREFPIAAKLPRALENQKVEILSPFGALLSALPFSLST